MLKQIDQTLKTLIIAPSKYHNIIYKQLLDNNKILFNIQVLNIETFLTNTLLENNLEPYLTNSMIDKLKLSSTLIKNNHQYATNINYLNEVYKLEKEFYLSNVTSTNENINFKAYNFTNITTTYQQVLIYTIEDLYPIHFDLLNNLSIPIIYNTNPTTSTHLLYEHNNIIRMLDYIIYEIYTKQSFDKTLIICDNDVQIDYLCDKFSLLNIPYQLENPTTTNTIYYLNSLFNILNNQATNLDYTNIKYINLDFNDFNDFNDLEYHSYLKLLYPVLIKTNLFELNLLNNTFKELYLLDSQLDLDNLNDYLLTLLKNKLNIQQDYQENALMIASSSFSSFKYEHAYLCDATFSSFSPSKTSYLLSTTQRNEISPLLIDNTYLNDLYKTKQQRLLNVANNIYIHYALINLENKPQSLAYFIDQHDYPLNNQTTYQHLSINTPLKDSKVNKDNPTLNKQDLQTKLNNTIKLSSTSLDKFFGCPYAYFVSYILKPRQSESIITSLDTGNISHHIMENINNHLIDNNLSLNDLTNQDILSLIQTNLTSQLELLNEKLKITIYQKEKLLNDITNNLYLNLTALKNFESFSKYVLTSAEKTLSYPINNSYFDNVTMVGNIDAIYQYQDYHYILDYKSSAKKFSENSFNAGISNQLIIYLSLLKHNDLNLAGAFYKAIKDGYINSDKILDTEYNQQLKIDMQKLEGILIDHPYLKEFDSSFESNLESSIANARFKEGRKKATILEFEQIMEYFKTLDTHIDKMLESLNNAQFKVLPYDSINCEYCDFQSICKVNSNTLTRKELESNV